MAKYSDLEKKLLEALNAMIEMHGCHSCWSDDYNCTCEQEKTALRGLLPKVSEQFSSLLHAYERETEVHRFEDSVDADSVEFPSGEIHTVDYKKGYRAHAEAVEKKRKAFWDSKVIQEDSNKK